jgi:formylglycine-generating enzyme required for sulfatase activity
MGRAKTAFLWLAPALLAAQPQTQTKTWTNTVGMEFAEVPAGSFVMGRFQAVCAAAGAQGNVTEAQHAECVKMARESALPGFRAEIAKPFLIGRYEVTQEQYRRVMGRNPSHYDSARLGESSDKYPVDSVAWKDAQAFVKKLNALERTKAYRLPTEAEWEYAARAGTEDETQGAKRQEVAWYMSNAGYKPHPAGAKRANAWGLHDMLGNVWEWVADFYDERVQPAGPKGPASGKQHVLRGGSFSAHEKNVRVSVHAGGPGSVINTGFRVVRDLPVPPR